MNINLLDNTGLGHILSKANANILVIKIPSVTLWNVNRSSRFNCCLHHPKQLVMSKWIWNVSWRNWFSPARWPINTSLLAHLSDPQVRLIICKCICLTKFTPCDILHAVSWIRSVTSTRSACRKIGVLSLILSQRQLACEGLYCRGGNLRMSLQSVPISVIVERLAHARQTRVSSQSIPCCFRCLRVNFV